MKIKEYELEVDVLDEIEQFEWVNGVIKGNKFLACSPFRSERHASFAVNLETGTFIDSGNSDEYYHKGNLVKLLAALRNEDYETVEDYLIEKYATILADTETLELNLNLQGEQDTPVIINRIDIKHLYTHSTDYFTNRGISLEVQQLFELGFNSQSRTVAMLWTDDRMFDVQFIITYPRFFYRVQRVENLGSVTSVRFKRNGKMFYFTQIKTFYEAMEFLTQMAIMPSNRKRDYTVADERRTKILINTLLTIGFIMVLISILFILNPLVSADGSAPM